MFGHTYPQSSDLVLELLAALTGQLRIVLAIILRGLSESFLGGVDPDFVSVPC